MCPTGGALLLSQSQAFVDAVATKPVHALQQSTGLAGHASCPLQHHRSYLEHDTSIPDDAHAHWALKFRIDSLVKNRSGCVVRHLPRGKNTTTQHLAPSRLRGPSHERATCTYHRAPWCSFHVVRLEVEILGRQATCVGRICFGQQRSRHPRSCCS